MTPWSRSLARSVRVAFLHLAAATTLSAATGVEGTWHGALEVGAARLRLALHVERGGDDVLSATMDSLDQGALGIRVDSISLEGSLLRFAIVRIGGSYEGSLDPSGDRIEGTWSQSGLSLPLVLERGLPPEIRRPQEPTRPYPYREEEAAFVVPASGPGAGPLRLSGTLTLPRGAGPHPAVLLVSGSGPQDRDETVFGHRPFLVLADHLTRRGIAVLRYDDRGVGASGGSLATATMDDLVGEALAGAAYLRDHEAIDASRVGVLGHSLGALVATLAASRASEIAFLVLIAGPGVPGSELILLQGELLLREAGASPEVIATNRELQRRLFELVAREPFDAEREEQVRSLLLDHYQAMPARDRQALAAGGDPAQVAAQQARTFATPWLRCFLRDDPRPALRRLTCPVLAVNGEKDLQVSAAQNLQAISAALAEAPTSDVTVLELPGLNHLLQTAVTGAVSEYATTEETMAPRALETIGEWVASRTAGR